LVKKLSSKLKVALIGIRGFLEERGVGTAEREASRLHRFAHFWLLVGKSFSRNRCPVRAAALAYTTLLALIPMLAVALSVSTSILKKQGEDQVLHFVDKMIASVMPPAVAETNAPTGILQRVWHSPRANAEASSPAAGTNSASAVIETAPEETNGAADESAPSEPKMLDARQQVARSIGQFIKNTNSGTWGVTGTVLLILVAITMLARVEGTFNDIWGVERGRSWFARIWQYWGVITLGPLLLALGLAFASGTHLGSTHRLISCIPLFGGVLLPFTLHLLPVLVLSLAFALLYMLMPNTKVHWQAAIAGGLVAGLLWHLNDVFSVLYVSRVITNSRIYGGLAIVPVFMVGLYIGWLILLFGAQVAYAYQNREAYVQAKQADNVNQRGREFIALRVMACIGWRFQRGEAPGTVPEIATQLAVPSRLVQQLLHVLVTARLVVEVAGNETAYAPARPLDAITCHDVLTALRAGQGQELATSDEPARTEVFGEFQQILEAERKAASAVTVLAMVGRVEARALTAARDADAEVTTPNLKA
jgi:membrane protein